MTLWVPDASVACKWHFDEADSALAEAALLRDGAVVAPDSFLSEFANAVSRKIRTGETSRARGERMMREIVGQVAHFVPVRELLPLALEMSVELRHPIYDCLYLALAARDSEVMVTDDQVFLRKAMVSRWHLHVMSLREFVDQPGV